MKRTTIKRIWNIGSEKNVLFVPEEMKKIMGIYII